jgi:hypothetical protein
MSNEIKTRMVSFRLSEEEYTRLHRICFAQGLRSVSDLARAGINMLLQQPDRATPETLESRVTEIENRLRILSIDMRRLNQGGGTSIGPPAPPAAKSTQPCPAQELNAVATLNPGHSGASF